MQVRSVHDEAQLMNSILHLRESLRSQRPAKEFVSDAVRRLLRPVPSNALSLPAVHARTHARTHARRPSP